MDLSLKRYRTSLANQSRHSDSSIELFRRDIQESTHQVVGHEQLLQSKTLENVSPILRGATPVTPLQELSLSDHLKSNRLLTTTQDANRASIQEQSVTQEIPVKTSTPFHKEMKLKHLTFDLSPGEVSSIRAIYSSSELQVEDSIVIDSMFSQIEDTPMDLSCNKLKQRPATAPQLTDLVEETETRPASTVSLAADILPAESSECRVGKWLLNKKNSTEADTPHLPKSVKEFLPARIHFPTFLSTDDNHGTGAEPLQQHQEWEKAQHNEKQGHAQDSSDRSDLPDGLVEYRPLISSKSYTRSIQAAAEPSPVAVQPALGIYSPSSSDGEVPSDEQLLPAKVPRSAPATLLASNIRRHIYTTSTPILSNPTGSRPSLVTQSISTIGYKRNNRLRYSASSPLLLQKMETRTSAKPNLTASSKSSPKSYHSTPDRKSIQKLTRLDILPHIQAKMDKMTAEFAVKYPLIHERFKDIPADIICCDLRLPRNENM